MGTVVIVGGGLSGAAAAVAAAKAGVETILLEKMDMLAGLGLLTGVLDGEAGFVAGEEAKAMGGGEIFESCESVITHRIDYIEKINRRNVRVFNVIRLDEAVRKALDAAGVKTMLKARAKNIKSKAGKITHVVLDDGTAIEGQCFVDATGGAGTVGECTKYGYGCVMCIMRCPTFGGRVSISAKAGAKDLVGLRANGKPGAFNSAFMMFKESLAPDIQAELNKVGYIIIPLPKELIRYEKLEAITATANAEPAFIENLVIFNNGYAKVMVQSFMLLDELRAVPGLENARMADPISGGVGNAVRMLAIAPRDNAMKVEGVENLYCAGEKAGPKSGISAAIVTGLLAGYNAARYCRDKESLQLPRSTAIGDFIAFEKEQMASEQGMKSRVSFGGAFFQRMKKMGLYTQDAQEIRKRVEKEGLSQLLAKRLS